MRLALVETVKRFYCWIRDGKPYCTWLVYRPDFEGVVDCTDMDDERFSDEVQRLENVASQALLARERLESILD